MVKYYLKLSAKVNWWHLLGQAMFMAIGFVAFGLLMANYRIAEILASIFMTGGYVIYMYSKLYKVGERDTKSYVQEKPYMCKGIVLYIGLFFISLLFAVLYKASFSTNTLLAYFLGYFPFRIWGYTYIGFMKTAGGAISVFYWILYFGVPLVSCAVGYYAGMRRWDLGYHFFKNFAYKKKK